MKQIIIFIALFTASVTLLAQSDMPDFRVEVSTDSVLFGNAVKVSFVLEQADGGRFQPPTFQGFDIVSGPSTTSSISMVNGQVSRSVRYVYYLRPRAEGEFFIQPASIEVDGELYESDPVLIAVYPNPDGVKQEPDGESLSPFGQWPFNMEMPAVPFGEGFFDMDRMPFDLKPFLEMPPQDSIPVRKKRKTYRI